MVQGLGSRCWNTLTAHHQSTSSAYTGVKQGNLGRRWSNWLRIPVARPGADAEGRCSSTWCCSLPGLLSSSSWKRGLEFPLKICPSATLSCEKAGLKLNFQRTKVTASGPITSWQIDGAKIETVTDSIFLGSKITADGDCSHEIKRRLFLGRKAMTNLDSILKSRDIALHTKVHIVKAMVFPVVVHGYTCPLMLGGQSTEQSKCEFRMGAHFCPCLTPFAPETFS